MRIFTETGHVSDDSLALHILSDLTEAHAERVEEHLRQCQSCRDQFKQTQDFLALFRALAQAQAGRSGLNCTIGAIRMGPRIRARHPKPTALAG